MDQLKRITIGIFMLSQIALFGYENRATPIFKKWHIPSPPILEKYNKVFRASVVTGMFSSIERRPATIWHFEGFDRMANSWKVASTPVFKFNRSYGNYGRCPATSGPAYIYQACWQNSTFESMCLISDVIDPPSQKIYEERNCLSCPQHYAHSAS